MSNSSSADFPIERTVSYSSDISETETIQIVNDGVCFFKVVCLYDSKDNEPINRVIDYSKEVERRFYQKVNGVSDQL